MPCFGTSANFDNYEEEEMIITKHLHTAKTLKYALNSTPSAPVSFVTVSSSGPGHMHYDFHTPIGHKAMVSFPTSPVLDKDFSMNPELPFHFESFFKFHS